MEGVIIMDMKICVKCLKELPATSEYFHKQKSGKYGFRSTCKVCRSENIKHYSKEEIIKNLKPTKKCTCCGEIKLTSTDFHSDIKSKDGLYTQCKDCVKISTKKYLEHNREKNKESCKNRYQLNKKEYHARNKEWIENNKDKHLKYQKEYRIENKEKLNENSKLHYIRNKKKYQELNKEWRKKNPNKLYKITSGYRFRNKDKYKIYSQKRRASINKTVNTLTEKDWKEALNFFGEKCSYCGCEEGFLHQEHVIPASKGGAYNKQNIIPACPSCNTKKWTHDMEEWYMKQEFFDQSKLEKIHKWIGYDKKNNMQQLSIL